MPWEAFGHQSITLNYMRALAQGCPEFRFGQQPAAQLSGSLELPTDGHS